MDPLAGKPGGLPRKQPISTKVESEFDRLLTLVDLDLGLDAHNQALDRLLAFGPQMKSLSPDERFAYDLRVATCLSRVGRMEEARITARAALDAAPPSTAAIDMARALLVSAKAGLELGLLSASRADALAALEAMGDGGLQVEAGRARNILGTVAFRAGEPDLAREHFEKAAEIFRKLGDLQHLAGCYKNLGNLHKLRCDWERAAEHYNVAYYLGTTLGEYSAVAGAAQNLGIVLSKTGRFREAEESLQRALRLGTEMGDGACALRARLALAKLGRSELRVEQAREFLDACRPEPGQAVPEREHCLWLLEQARLDLEEGAGDRLATRAEELRLRVEAMAPRGDLMVEVLLLDADAGAMRGDWAEVEIAAARAADLARADRDRSQEERAMLRLARVWARTGRPGEAIASLRGLLERRRARGEWPAAVSALRALAEIESEVAGDPDAALTHLTQAAEIVRRLDSPRLDARIAVEKAFCHFRGGRVVEAQVEIDSARRLAATLGPVPGLAERIEDLDRAIRDRTLVETIDPLDGLTVHRRLEEILTSGGSVWERIPEILGLLREALELDAVLLGRVGGEDVDILAESGAEPRRGRRTVQLAELGLTSLSDDHASVQQPQPGTAGAEGQSRLTIPIRLRGRRHILHLERSLGGGRAPLGRAERNYAMVLTLEIARALDLGSPDAEERRLSRGIALADVITEDPRMIRLLDLVRRVGDTDLTILLQGETGTGKKLFAHAVHRASSRRDRPIVTVDCAALPESLLEAELFGYRKGAFTGAVQDRRGLLAEAAGGTIFLDEIDKAGLTVQRRFLHLLDSGEIRPVGSTSYLRLDVRIICATSCPDLREEVAKGQFLKDLYYRLNDISIEIPPLRERAQDILLLAGCFVESYAGHLGRRIRGMSAAFRRALLAHDWPGNVRELEKSIRRAVTLADEDAILTPELLPREVLESMEETGEERAENLKRKVELFERRAIERALQDCGGNKSRAAMMLGMSRKGLKGKILRYRLQTRSSLED